MTHEEQIKVLTESWPCDIVAKTGTPEWFAGRSTGIGASEIGKILRGECLPLYAQKVGAVPPPDLSEIQAVKWGARLEATVRRGFATDTNQRVIHFGYMLRSKIHEWALATPDALILKGSEVLLLEIKTTSAFRAEDWVEGCPPYYLPQLHQQMLVCGANKATIMCLIGGNRPAWTVLDKDEQMIRQIIHQGEKFWRQVQSRTPPAPDSSQATKEALAALYATPEEKTVELPALLQERASLLLDLKAQRRHVEESIQGIENELKAALGPATLGYFTDGTGFSWKLQQRAEHVVKASEFRQLRYLITKE